MSEIAARVNCTPTYVSQVLRGERRNEAIARELALEGAPGFQATARVS